MSAPPDMLFWDVGGVLLTNGWDREARRRAGERFGLEPDEFEDRHAQVLADFETGRLSLDQYLEQTVFHRARPYSVEAFKAFMYAQSEPYSERLEIVRALARDGRYRLATLNNESLELNLHRMDRFALREIFSLFFSSCFVGLRKPDAALYRTVLQVTQCAPERCMFIDDRALNLECAARLGMRTVHYQNPGQLLGALTEAGIDIRPKGRA